MCLCLCKSVNTHLFLHMKDSIHVYGYICTHTNTHVPVWVCVYLCTFLHKFLGVSQNVPHEPPEASICFYIVYVCAPVFLHLWGYESVNTLSGWHIYISVCFSGLYKYGVFIYNYMLLCVYTQNCGHLHVTLCMHMCIHIYMKSCLPGLWMLCLYCALRMYGLYDYDTPVGLCQYEHLWHCMCIYMFCCVCSCLWWISVCVGVSTFFWTDFWSFTQLLFYNTTSHNGVKIFFIFLK